MKQEVLNKKTIVITGASDGIGAAAATQLKELGHHVIIVGRTKEKTEKLAAKLDVPYHLADYTDLSEVTRLAKELDTYDKIDVFINNAGGVFGERKITKDGFEKTFQVNLLAAFMLTNLLMDKLCQSKATVIQTTSLGANLLGTWFDVEDLNNEKSYSPGKAYGEAKLGNIFFTRELHRRFGGKGISAVAFEPGIVRSNFGSESIWFFNFAYHSFLRYLFTISPEKSAKMMVDMALGKPGVDFESGETYRVSGKRFKVKFKDKDGKVANRLWEICEEWMRIRTFKADLGCNSNRSQSSSARV